MVIRTTARVVGLSSTLLLAVCTPPGAGGMGA